MYPYSYALRISPAHVVGLLIAVPFVLFACYVSVLIVPMIVREVVAVVVPTVIAGTVGS
jgi:hypothetical protein